VLALLLARLSSLLLLLPPRAPVRLP
jgi:hypothetical protein